MTVIFLNFHFIFYKIYFDHNFLYPNSSRILLTSQPTQFHAHAPSFLPSLWYSKVCRIIPLFFIHQICCSFIHVGTMSRVLWGRKTKKKIVSNHKMLDFNWGTNIFVEVSGEDERQNLSSWFLHFTEGWEHRVSSLLAWGNAEFHFH